MQSLPGPTPQNTTVDYSAMSSDSLVKLARYRRRLQSLMRALYTVSGQAMRNSLVKQQELLKVGDLVSHPYGGCEEASSSKYKFQVCAWCAF